MDLICLKSFLKKKILQTELSKKPKSLIVIDNLLKEHADVKLIKIQLNTLPKFSKKKNLILFL